MLVYKRGNSENPSCFTNAIYGPVQQKWMKAQCNLPEIRITLTLWKVYGDQFVYKDCIATPVLILGRPFELCVAYID